MGGEGLIEGSVTPELSKVLLDGLWFDFDVCGATEQLELRRKGHSEGAGVFAWFLSRCHHILTDPSVLVPTSH